MTRITAVLIAVLAHPGVVAAQTHIAHGASGLAHGVPDFCATATERLVVPAGQTRTLTGRFETSCLGVHGTLIIASNTTVFVDELLIYADGAVIVGTAEQPATGVDIVIRDRALDLAGDPEQFGQGILGFGKFSLNGDRTTGSTRSITIRSENPLGTRGHVLLTQRADVDIRYVAFVDLGRTRAAQPLDSTTFSGEIATRTGTNQIGRYPLHLHHVMGPLPGSGRANQFALIGNLFVRGEKWGGITLHNSHFGLMQENRCIQPTAVCYVEEDGSETGNQWIGNYAGQATGALCDVDQYDPEGRCPSGFWLRGQNQVVTNNIVEDMQRGIVWWSGCLEMNGPPCGVDAKVTIPKFRGADTSDPAQIDACQGRDGSVGACTVGHRVGLAVSGNTIRRGSAGLELWWTGRVQRNSPRITNTVIEQVATPILLHYSDVAIDGLTATGCTTLIRQFNDASVNLGPAESSIARTTANCSDAIYSRFGQLHQAPAWRFSDSTLTSPNGLRITLGGQRTFTPVSTVKVENSTFSGAIFTTSTQTFDLLPEQRILMSATNVNGRTFTQTLPDGAQVSPPAPPTSPTSPTPAPQPGVNAHPATPALPDKPCRFPPELNLCR
jgi:hypothetical protein